MDTLKIRLILLCGLLLSLKANAYDFEVDGIYYNKLTDFTVSVTYKDTDYNSYSGSIVIPKEVVHEGKHYTVTEIGYNAFSSCKRLRSLTLPNSIMTIVNCAIRSCESLTELYIEDGNSVLSLGHNNASNTSLLGSCSNLEYLYLGRNIDNNHSISPFGKLKYLSTVEIGDSVTDMSDISCFSQCTGLTSIKIGKNVESIGASEFYGCTSLTSIVIPDKVKTIGSNAFYGCKSLSSITIGESVEKIEGPFYGCTSLTSITLPKSVTYVRLGQGSDPSINSITLLGKVPPTIGDSFSSRTLLKMQIKVPKGYLEVYQAAEGWKDFFEFEEVDFIYRTEYLIDGEIYRTDSIHYGEQINTPEEPYKEGYTFNGWEDVPISMPARDITINGTFSINKYQVSYMIDGAIYAVDSIEYGVELPSKTAPSKEYHTFSGWSEIPKTMPANDIVINGSFIANKYKLSYVIDGQTYLTQEVEYNKKISLIDNPTKEGHTFNGWSEIPETMPAQDVTVTGSFSVNTYKLTYMVDGMVYMSSYVTYGDAIFPMAPPTKEGYIFSGWSEIPATMPASDVVVTGSFEVDGIENITNDMVVDVYNLQGIKVKEQVLFEDLESILPQGMYIVNRRKLLVK